jgi:hypothetical protein
VATGVHGNRESGTETMMTDMHASSRAVHNGGGGSGRRVEVVGLGGGAYSSSRSESGENGRTQDQQSGTVLRMTGARSHKDSMSIISIHEKSQRSCIWPVREKLREGS